MIDLNAIRAKIQVPQQLQGAYQRLIQVGRKIMYQPQIVQQFTAKIKQGAPVGQTLGEGVAGVVLMLVSKSKGLPQELILPVTLELALDALDALQQAGVPFQKEDVGTAVQTAMAVIVKAAQRAGQGQQGQPAQPAKQPGPQSAQGLVGAQMGA